MGQPCSEAIKISALTTWPAIKWIENLVSRQLESPFSTFRGWMDENQALLFWCLASIIRIVWRTTDSCCVCLGTMAARTCLCSTYPRDQRSRDKQFPGDEEELAFSDSKGHAPKRPLRFASHLLVGDLLRAPATSIINCWLHQVHILNLFDIEMKETYRKRCVEQSGSA